MNVTMKNSSKFVKEGYLHILSIFILLIIVVLSGDEMNLRFYNVMCVSFFDITFISRVKILQSFSTFVMVFGSEFIL